MIYELTQEQAQALKLAAEGELEAEWPEEFDENRQHLRDALAILKTPLLKNPR